MSLAEPNSCYPKSPRCPSLLPEKKSWNSWVWTRFGSREDTSQATWDECLTSSAYAFKAICEAPSVLTTSVRMMMATATLSNTEPTCWCNHRIDGLRNSTEIIFYILHLFNDGKRLLFQTSDSLSLDLENPHTVDSLPQFCLHIQSHCIASAPTLMENIHGLRLHLESSIPTCFWGA